MMSTYRPLPDREPHTGFDSGCLTVVGVLVIVLVALVVWSAVNPRLNLPVISELVCMVKGGDWRADGQPAGCYARQDR